MLSSSVQLSVMTIKASDVDIDSLLSIASFRFLQRFPERIGVASPAFEDVLYACCIAPYGFMSRPCTLRVFLHSATGLLDADAFSPSDPYVVLTLLDADSQPLGESVKSRVRMPFLSYKTLSCRCNHHVCIFDILDVASIADGRRRQRSMLGATLCFCRY
jgi:hypothetical protein